MAAATYADLKIFHPEFIKTMFLDVRPPTRLHNELFGAPTSMGLFSFSQGSFDDPFAILPPVNELEDAKSMFAEQGITDYKLQDYRGFVDVSNKVIKQFMNASNMPGLIRNLRDRYAMVLREGFENTIEYTCFKALDNKAVLNTGTTDWTLDATTSDSIIKDLQKAKQHLMDNQRIRATTCILNPEAETDLVIRKDLSNMLYNGRNNAIETGYLGTMLGLNFVTQPSAFTDFEGNSLSMFAPTTAGKALAYVCDPRSFGYPVIFGTPEFTTVDNPSKDSVRIYVNASAGFVYNRPEVEKITA